MKRFHPLIGRAFSSKMLVSKLVRKPKNDELEAWAEGVKKEIRALKRIEVAKKKALKGMGFRRNTLQWYDVEFCRTSIIYNVADESLGGVSMTFFLLLKTTKAGGESRLLKWKILLNLGKIFTALTIVSIAVPVALAMATPIVDPKCIWGLVHFKTLCFWT